MWREHSKLTICGDILLLESTAKITSHLQFYQSTSSGDEEREEIFISQTAHKILGMMIIHRFNEDIKEFKHWLIFLLRPAPAQRFGNNHEI